MGLVWPSELPGLFGLSQLLAHAYIGIFQAIDFDMTTSYIGVLVLHGFRNAWLGIAILTHGRRSSGCNLQPACRP